MFVDVSGYFFLLDPSRIQFFKGMYWKVKKFAEAKTFMF